MLVEVCPPPKATSSFLIFAVYPEWGGAAKFVQMRLEKIFIR